MVGSPCQYQDKTKCICCKYKSPIIVDKLLPRLNEYSHHHASAAGKLREGFSNGFKLGFEGVRQDRDALNLKSAIRDPNRVIEKLDKEIRLGRIAGPFNNRPLPNLTISPFLQTSSHYFFQGCCHFSCPTSCMQTAQR